jgi:phosphatidylserine decarboxylase
MRIPLGPLSPVCVPVFARMFKINTDEAEFAPASYKSFNKYFTRKLKPGLRPVQGPLVHPVDGLLTENGTVVSGELVQAKGWQYSLEEFLGDAARAKMYEGGSFVTYYLCPTDYHRVHSPHAGEMVSAKHIPGMLWPVNSWSVGNVKRLFNLNERIVFNFDSEQGPWSLVMVGATNVGQMTATLDPSISTNKWLWHAPTERAYSPPLPIQPGDELGVFHLGSTAICIYQWKLPQVLKPKSVRMGEAFP